MSRFAFALAVVLASAIVTGAAGEGKPTDEGAKTPVLDATSGATHRYLPVAFTSHDRHAKDLGIACAACHHDLRATMTKPAKCGTCHDQAGARVSLADATHKSCRGCHDKYVAEHKGSTAPTECLGCHQERK